MLAISKSPMSNLIVITYQILITFSFDIEEFEVAGTVAPFEQVSPAPNTVLTHLNENAPWRVSTNRVVEIDGWLH